MRRVFPLLALMSLAFAPAPVYRGKPKADLESLRGEWHRIGYVLDGKAWAVREGEYVGDHSGVRMKVRRGRESCNYEFTFRPPAARTFDGDIDVAAGALELRGLYRLRGDELTLCYDYTGRGQRPNTVEGKANILIEVYKRKKP